MGTYQAFEFTPGLVRKNIHIILKNIQYPCYRRYLGYWSTNMRYYLGQIRSEFVNLFVKVQACFL
jgi:hypothetical protein